MEDVASGSGGVHSWFKERSGSTRTVPRVSPPEPFIPNASAATDAEGAAGIDALISRRRAELARMALAARAARTRCERVEDELRAHHAARPTDPGPHDLLDVVDAMMEKAMTTAAAAIESARREAVSVVELAREVGATELKAVGADPATVPLGSGSRPLRRDVSAPRTAAELWNEVRGPMPTPVVPPGLGARVVRTGPVVSPMPPASPSSLLNDAGASAVTIARSAPTDVAPSNLAQGQMGGQSAGPATLLLGDPELDPETDGRVFDTFWGQMPADRRVRSRFRRRATREEA